MHVREAVNDPLEGILQRREIYIKTRGIAGLSHKQTKAAITRLLNQAVEASLQRVSHTIGGEEEPDFDPGDATYGDSEHDHNAVVYGRNELKGEVQAAIHNELDSLTHTEEKPNA